MIDVSAFVNKLMAVFSIDDFNNQKHLFSIILIYSYLKAPVTLLE